MTTLYLVLLSVSLLTFDLDLDFNRHSVTLDGPIRLVHTALIDRLDDLRRDRLFLLYNSGEISEIELQRNLPLYRSPVKGPKVRWGTEVPILRTGFFTLLNTGGVQLKYPRLAADFSSDEVNLLFTDVEPTVKRGLTITARPDISISSRPPYLRQAEFALILYYYERRQKAAAFTFSYLYNLEGRTYTFLVDFTLLLW
jgi:hypothetical protein